MARNYDKEFKLNAVAVYRKSGKAMEVIAEEMGIPKSTFTGWVRAFNKDDLTSFPGKGRLKNADQELSALRKELHHVRLERDILKKAVAIFSGPSGKGTNS